MAQIGPLEQARIQIAAYEEQIRALKIEHAAEKKRADDLQTALDLAREQMAAAEKDAHAGTVELERTRAKLGRAVAALRVLRDLGEEPGCGCAFCGTHDDVINEAIADAESTAAGDAYEETENLYRAAQIERSRNPDSMTLELEQTLAKVEARRDGGKGGAGPLRSVEELIAAAENPPPVFHLGIESAACGVDVERCWLRILPGNVDCAECLRGTKARVRKGGR